MVEYVCDALGDYIVAKEDDIAGVSAFNPFRWKSLYYEDEVGQFVTLDYSSINPLVIGGD